jgi:adenylate cyclase
MLEGTLADQTVLRVGDFVLDLAAGRLRDSSGAEVPIRPKSLDVLGVLARNAGRTMSKDELLEAVWPGIHVTEDSLVQSVRDVRRAIGDPDGCRLRTIQKRGYLLDVAVTSLPAAAGPQPAGIELDRPSVAVLPFANLGGGPEDGYFAEGITSEILTGLLRIRWLVVIGRGSSFLFKNAVDLREVGRRLGTRYVLQGSIRRADNRVRIICDITEAASGRQIWADRFEGTLADIFVLQDHIVACVIGAVEPTIRLAEVERARSKPTESLDAYDLYLRALPLHLSNNRARLQEAQRLLARAVTLDPSYSLAKAFSALTAVIQVNQSWASEEERRHGIRMARQASADHRDDPVTLRCAAHALCYLAHEADTALPLLQRALALHPNSAEVHHSAGWVWCFVCDGARAEPHFQQAIRLSPLDQEMGHTLMGLTFAQLLTRRPDEALATSRRAMAAMPTSISPVRSAIMALQELGRAEEAQTLARRLMEANPDFRVGAFSRVQPFQDPSFAGRYMAALRHAGLPE